MGGFLDNEKISYAGWCDAGVWCDATFWCNTGDGWDDEEKTTYVTEFIEDEEGNPIQEETGEYILDEISNG